jgi:amidohydrolase
MTRDDLKRQVYAAIDARADEIIGLGEQIRRTPELGFKEFKTAGLVEKTLGRIGLSPRTGLAITGVRADLPGGGGDGPTFAMLGELDALVVAGHPEADPATGAAHACGHNAQVAGLLGAAMGLVDAKAAPHLAGRLVFFAVPAEEYGDVEWRVSQARAGKLEFLGGKPELLRRGHFDDVDLSMMIHGTSRPEDGKAGVPASNNGCIVKTVRYLGKAAHAGGAPHLGVNALYAAQIALLGINAIRETFRDEDTIRVHPIITHGGSQVNVIPGEARMETYVRGRTVEAIMEANARVDRALRAGALALGAQVEIETLPGYMPMQCDATMAAYFKDTATRLVGEENYRQIGHRTGSTDMGDLSQVMPVLHPYIGGARGTGHGADYEIVDKPLMYLAPAKALAAMAIDLLFDGAAGARRVLEAARPPMTREQYLALQRSVGRREVYAEGTSTAPSGTSPR